MADDTTIGEALRNAAAQLATCTDAPRLEAELLLAHALGVSRSHLFAWPGRALDTEPRQRYADLLRRRATGEPVAYLTGERDFWTLRLQVTPDVLIPRPETELLVELAMNLLPKSDPCRVADLGTGSGAIALALARGAPAWRVTATDRSDAALLVARANASRLGVSNVEFAQGDWCGALAHRDFDLIASNPPYIAEGDPHLEHHGLPFEPALALTSGTDGLDALRRIVGNARAYLRPGGWLALEHGATQGTAVREMMGSGGYLAIVTHADLAGLPRATLAQTRA